jgi:hypothetical protein
MKINPNDPWYPNPYKLGEQCPHGIMGGCEECLGVTIRLKLAADALKSPLLRDFGVARNLSIADGAFAMADDLIERANRDEEKHDEGGKDTRIENGHLMIYCDPDRPGGGFWRHSCESEEQCGNYTDERSDDGK